MGVQTVTTTVATCDECTDTIDMDHPLDSWVDASVYGVAFHASCWERIGGPRVARVLYLDDIHYKGGRRNGERAMGARS